MKVPKPPGPSGALMVRIRAAGAEDRLVVQEMLGQLGYVFTAEEVQARLKLLATSDADPVLLAT